ncbi:gonadotropin subunit beta-1-like [Thalassophryne amazonica]|uniref:gonadotropin subunit beta-1-like n=1 Tax=Thalassophryne amazonica TaxID=390379 RepID=UPI001471878C|nr:gonadotropin subunit beta-1-like [Thalassophryne amazonica]
MCCGWHRMQLVVMAAVLALAGVGRSCHFGCHPINISIEVESCGMYELIYTTICAGQCANEDPVYIGHDDWPRQTICNGDWSYEVTHIKGCLVAVSYPVARNCRCTGCDTGNTYCGHFYGDMHNCLSLY